MRSTRLWYLLFVLIICFWCCTDEYEEVTKTLSISPYSILEIESVFSIYLVEDTVYSVTIVGHKDVVNQIEATVNDGVLTLKDNNKQKWLHPSQNKVKIYVHSPEHYRIDARTSYALRSVNTIKSEQLWIVNDVNVKVSEIDLMIDCRFTLYWNNYTAGGRLVLRGKSEGVQIDNHALHTINSTELEVQSGIVNNYAQGDCRIYIAQRLEYQVHGPGNIYLYGNPPEIVLLQQTSTGRLIEVN